MKKYTCEKQIKDCYLIEYRYDHLTGLLYKGDSIIKGSNNGGYIRLSIHEISVAYHRFVWRLFYGSWPIYNIDHINGVKSDNRIANLRDATDHENAANCVIHRNGKLPGVSWYKPKELWMASITVKYKLHKIGFYKTPEEAHEAYKIYRDKLKNEPT